jgi:glycosyltransferase involved in cell wall biosynthesis
MIAAPQPLVSVVVPVHNGADYLSECLESILCQSHQNWDCTIVDNFSTDETLAIARRYAARDSRIRVHENHTFLPAIANHNLALRHVSPASKYCKVVFADDWIFPTCLEQMVAVAEEHPMVGLVGAYCLEGQRVICTGLPYPSARVPGREICRQHLLNRLYVFGSANSVLYRADLLRNYDPVYNEANIHADTEACFALLRTSDFGFVHQVLTFSRVRPRSLTSTSNHLHTELAGMLTILRVHGSHYLTEEELRVCLDRHVGEYYRILSKSLFLGRNQEFWDYHKRHLAEAGVGFSWPRLARATLRNLYAAVILKDPVGKLLRARNRTRRATLAAEGSERVAQCGGEGVD